MSATHELRDAAEFINGVAFRPEDWTESGARIIRIQNLTDPTKPYNRTQRDVDERYVVKRGDILVSWSASLGVFEWRDSEQALLNQHIFRVLPRKGVDKSYLRYALKEALSAMELHLHGATMRHVNRGDFLSTRIPLPSVDEQRRIAAILDQADDLRQQRGKAIAVAEEIAGVAYRNLVMNDEALPVVAIADLATYMRTGPFGSQLLHSEFTETGISVLGIDNAVNNRFQWDGLRYIPESKFRQLKRFEVFPGDVIITIMGTLGRVAVVPSGIPRSISTKHLCSITLDLNRCLPEWLMGSLLYDANVRAQLGARERGAVMPGLNMQLIKSTRIKVPPMAVQERFSTVVMSVDRFLGTQRAHRAGLDDLFASLQHQFFADAGEGALVAV